MTLVYLAVAWGCGILVAQVLWAHGLLGCSTPGWPFAIPIVLGAEALVLLRRSPRPRLLSMLFLAAVLGGWRYHAHPFESCASPADLAFYHSHAAGPAWVTVEGVVVGYPDVRDVRTVYRLRAETLTASGDIRRVRGDVLVQASRFPEFSFGDRLAATGLLQSPPVFEDFDYRRYLAIRGISSLMREARIRKVDQNQGAAFWRLIYRVRSRGSAFLDRALPEPAAALANGMLLGIEGGIGADLNEAFKLTGASHVIVISGSNIALLSGALIAGLGRLLGRRLAALPAAAGIAFYVLLVGAESASLRAGLMGILYVIAIYLGRQSTAYVSLCASAVAMTLINPLALWDIGFQLSFLATLGLIFFVPAINTRLRSFLSRWLPKELGGRVLGIARDALVVTLAAQITTLPLLVYHFGRLSLVSVLTNALILPAQPAILGGGLASILLGMLWEPLGRLIALVPWACLTYTVGVVRLAAGVPLAAVSMTGDIRILALAYYPVLIALLLWRELHRRGRVSLPLGRAVAWAAAAALPIWVALTVLASMPDGRMRLAFVPGSEGEAALVVTPDGMRLWFWDGWGDGPSLVAKTRRLLTGFSRRVDVVLAPGSGELWPGAQQIDPSALLPGAVLALGRGVELTRLDAGEEYAFLLRDGSFRAILPASLPLHAQEGLLSRNQPSDLRVTLLKTPGPGTPAWPSVELLLTLAPQVILWPEETAYPPAVSEWLEGRGGVRVDADSISEVVTDGASFALRSWSGSSPR